MIFHDKNATWHCELSKIKTLTMLGVKIEFILVEAMASFERICIQSLAMSSFSHYISPLI
jgi:hypothetical protein